MHENLKTSLSLRKEDNLSTEHDNWQLLVPDYEYGTFFTLYGRFRGRCEGDIFHPKECDLHLQNYNGCITIGLIGFEEVDLIYDELLKQPVYLMKVHVKAMYANEQLLNQSIKLKQSFTIKNIDNFSTSEYVDFIDKKIYCKFNLRIELVFDEISEEYFNKKNLSESLIIDTIKYQRDGDQLIGGKYAVYNPETNKFKKPKGGEGHGNRRGALVDHAKGILYDDRCNPKYVKLLT